MSRDSLGVDWAKIAEVKAMVARKRNGIRRVSFVDMIGLNGEVGETNSIYHANEQEEKDNAEAQSSQREKECWRSFQCRQPGPSLLRPYKRRNLSPPSST